MFCCYLANIICTELGEMGLPITCTLYVYFFTLAVVKRQVAVKSTRGIALKSSHSLMVKSGGGGGGGGSGTPQGHGGGGGDSGPRNTRQFFDGEESCYIIDAKLEGNLGRYLNVSTRTLYLLCCLHVLQSDLIQQSHLGKVRNCLVIFGC